MRVFVTGGGGFIGSVVVRKLVEADRPVRCLLRDPNRATRLNGLNVECIKGDVRDSALVVEAMKGCDGAIHLASISSWNEIHSSEMEAVVVGGTQNILEAARAAGCSKAVYVSSSIAISASESPHVFDETSPTPPWFKKLIYAQAKIHAERLCRKAAQQGLHVVIVNPCEVYGPNDTGLVTAGNLADFANSSPVMVCSGGTSVVHVDDVAAGIIAALERGRSGERYILGGENLTVREIAEITLAALGKKKRILQMPNWILRPLGWLGRILRIPLPFNPQVIPYATQYWFMDNSKAQRELNVAFRSARETITPAVRWLQENGYIK